MKLSNRSKPVFGQCPLKSNHVCENGNCVRTVYQCYVEPRGCLSSTRGKVRCRGGYCAKDELDCLRPCGFATSTYYPDGTIKDTYTYNRTCPGYDGLCSRRHDFCPQTCPRGQIPCDDVCVYNNIYCSNVCFWYRCPGTGRCYSSSDQCNRIDDCPDGHDELGCTYKMDFSNGGSDYRPLPPVPPRVNPAPDMNYEKSFFTIAGVAAVAILIFICYMTKRLKRQSSSTATTHSASRVVVSGATIPLNPSVPPTASIAMYSFTSSNRSSYDAPWPTGPPTSVAFSGLPAPTYLTTQYDLVVPEDDSSEAEISHPVDPDPYAPPPFPDGPPFEAAAPPPPLDTPPPSYEEVISQYRLGR